ncbi:uncharacterized protein BYT42DRAFT_561317 [Radiomyces spectabilis]|uniref:uncharacterized protein n=1 Tax=Radiomyces spectabilis TaxID=64574 RepID=UPI00221FA917|nr:uncharacterized protein BYT42DRAFT_561317 [Radiomyces spectabilis]KAI8388809.1 hypothetical protein BYT42DRAFT_561317 [Radiomyces spectabilis]
MKSKATNDDSLSSRETADCGHHCCCCCCHVMIHCCCCACFHRVSCCLSHSYLPLPSSASWQFPSDRDVTPNTLSDGHSLAAVHSTPRDYQTAPQLNSLLAPPPNSLRHYKQSLRRQHVINELIQTERDYVLDLQHLVEVCFQTLLQQPWISREHKQAIVRNADDLLILHKNFLVTLESSPSHIDKEKECRHIANVFLEMGEHFMVYTHYCDLHDEAWSLCAEYRGRPEWTSFIRECMPTENQNYTSPSVQSGQGSETTTFGGTGNKRLHFEDYLIKPVQRICRYQLLLKEIIHHTPEDADEREPLDQALEIMQSIVAEIDERKHIRDTTLRTDRFIQRLDGDWRLNKHHVSQLGNILLAGALEVTYTALGQSVAKPRYLGCFVFPTYVILVRPKKVTIYEPKHWFPLRQAELEDIPTSEGQRENTFIVRCKKHTFAFTATCAQEKQLWVSKLKEAIDKVKNADPYDMSSANKPAEDLIVPSLPGVAGNTKASSSRIRLSQSFSNILDTDSPARSHSLEKDTSTSVSSCLRRSLSTSMQLDEVYNAESPTIPLSSKSFLETGSSSSRSLHKRYSVDYTSTPSKSEVTFKARNNSETYRRPSSEAWHSNIARRRPSSLDLLTSSPSTGSMIGKMSFQFKNNHQNAMRMAVDHKLRDVCTQDYLSSRAWFMREKDLAAAHSPTSSIDLRKRKSAPFMRSSASSFSLMMPRRTSDGGQSSKPSSPNRPPDIDVQSTQSSTSSLLDEQASPRLLRTNQASTSRQPSQSSNLRFSSTSQTYSGMQLTNATSDMATPHETDSCIEYPTANMIDEQENAPHPIKRAPSIPFNMFSRTNHSTSNYSLNMQASKPAKRTMSRLFHKLSKLGRRSVDKPSGNLASRKYHSELFIEDTSSELEHPYQASLSNMSMQFRKSQDSPLNKLLHAPRSKPSQSLFRWGSHNRPSYTDDRPLRDPNNDNNNRSSDHRSSAFAYASTPVQSPKVGLKEKLNVMRSSSKS